MANQTPAINVLDVELDGVDATDIGKAMRLTTTANTFTEAVANSRVAGKLVSAEKDGTKGGLQYQGVIRFPVANGVTVDASFLNLGILGAVNGTVNAYKAAVTATDGSPTDAELAAIANVRGTIVDFSNEANNKWVDVIFP